MAIKDVVEAARYSDSQLTKAGFDRSWAYEFWANQTPEGTKALMDDAYESARVETDDEFFIRVVVADIQRFVFGDEGDEAMGVPSQPAAESEIDGLLGAMTIRRMETWLEFVSGPEPEVHADLVEAKPVDYFLMAGDRLPVEGGIEIVSFDDPDGLNLMKGKKGYSKWPADPRKLAGKDPVWCRLLGFVHWDAGWSAAGAFRTLQKRGLGSTIGIDRPRKADGKVICYQWLDPGFYYGYHGSDANKRSVVSFDMSNAVYGKYAGKYRELCGIDRPLLKISGTEKVGSGDTFLGMYQDQILSVLYVLKAVGKYLNLPLVFPVKADGTPLGRNYKGLFKDDFHGVASHRHLPTTTKWDVQGLEAQIIAMLLTKPALMADFPSLVESFRLHDAKWASWLDEAKKSWTWKELWG